MGDDKKKSKSFEEIRIRASRKSYLYYYFLILTIVSVMGYIYFQENLTLNLYTSIGAAIFIAGIIKFTEIHRLLRLYVLTDTELIITDGILIKKTQRMKFRSFSDVSMTQSLRQRILGIGDIYLLQFDLAVGIKNINKPTELLKKITERL